jgi:hypothetical protein
MKKFAERSLMRIWSVLISLRLAVTVIISLAVSLAIATTIEAKFDSKTAQYFVYRAGWFFGILGLLGLNILAVAISRLPWKKKHIAFLMAHAGILMILIGSWITYVNGLDGSLRISEGEVTSAIELDEHVLVFKQGEKMNSKPFPWIPPYVAQNFKPVDFKEYGVRVERFISDAEMKVEFEAPAPGAVAPTAKVQPAAAIQIRILGSPMGGAPEFWLWAGDAGWSTQKLGPARFLIRREDQKDLLADQASGEARIDFIVSKKGELRYEAISLRGEKKTGKIVLNTDEPTIINPEWRMPLRVEVKKFVPLAMNHTEYTYAKARGPGMAGSGMPQPAIQISLISNPASRLWLGLGDRAEFNDTGGAEISVGYFPRRVILPFAMRLKKFEVKTNPGSHEAAAYASFVQVVDKMQSDQKGMDALPTTEISMNEPMDRSGYTFYQASYIPDFPRPNTTILSVNYDPGRALKYWGSILLICGAILLYVTKAFQKRKVGVKDEKEL